MVGMKFLLAIAVLTWGIASFNLGYSLGYNQGLAAERPATFNDRFGVWPRPSLPPISPWLLRRYA
jgi:hypothetical protein